MGRMDVNHLLIPRLTLLVASSSRMWLPGCSVPKDETTTPSHLETVLAGLTLRYIQFLGVIA